MDQFHNKDKDRFLSGVATGFGWGLLGSLTVVVLLVIFFAAVARADTPVRDATIGEQDRSVLGYEGTFPPTHLLIPTLSESTSNGETLSCGVVCVDNECTPKCVSMTLDDYIRRLESALVELNKDNK